MVLAFPDRSAVLERIGPVFQIGCQSETDKYSHLKMVTAVGVVMGLHAAYEIFIGGTQVTWEIIWTYLPVSLLYISSMAMGYIGLRYIELSISSPSATPPGVGGGVVPDHRRHRRACPGPAGGHGPGVRGRGWAWA